MSLFYFLVAFLGSGAGAVLVGFLARDWLAVRIKAAIDKEAHVQRAAFELKRSACLDALAVIDAAFSQKKWSQDQAQIKAVGQPLDISAARRAYNQLALTCRNPGVLELYARTLGLHAPDEPSSPVTTDLLVDLRNAMRQELGFGVSLEFDRGRAWIATLDGAT